MGRKKQEVQVERVAISSGVEWDAARSGIAELNQLLAREISFLEANQGIRNAYSPVTWLKLCHAVRHVAEGMTAVRLATEGMSAAQINAATGISIGRIAAFKAWNTQYGKRVKHWLTIKFHKQEERKADIAFLRSIGIAVQEEAAAPE